MAKDAKSILEKIKQLFADTLPTSYKLADGTDVTISLLDVGGDVTMGGQPAAEGTYTLMDGTNIVVDSTGKITEVNEPSEFEATEYTLADGTKVSIDKLEVGGKVIQGESPIANGEYTLEDGSKITTVDGAITVVTPKEAAPEKMSREKVQEAYDAIAGADSDNKLANVIICVNALMEWCFGWEIEHPEMVENAQKAQEDAQHVQDAINVYKQGLEGQFKAKFEKQENLITKQGETITKMLELMTQLAESPAGDPPPPNERKIVFSNNKTKKSAIEKYAEAAQKLHEETVKN